MSRPEEKVQLTPPSESRFNPHDDSNLEKRSSMNKNDPEQAQQETVDVVTPTAVAAATDKEHHMGVKEAFKRYPKSVVFSVIFSSALIMEGYDLVMIASFYAQPQFVQKFGEFNEELGEYNLSADWQTGLQMAVQCGSIMGLIASGWITDRFGYKKTMLGALFAMCCFIFITFFAVNVEMLLVGEFFCGWPWGIFQALAVSFASEICPGPIRPYLTTYVNLCWVMGQFIASGVLRGTLDIPNEWAFRIPFALQWLWPPLIAIGVILSPESPWWLVRHGRLEDARRSLRTFTGKTNTEEDIENTIQHIAYTNELERKYAAGTSYIDCFRGVNLRRTECSALTWFIQSWCGASFMGYSTYFYQQAGLPTERSFDMSMVQYALGAIGTILSWFALSKFGRRTLYIWGMVGMEIALLLIGLLAIGKPNDNPGIAWAVGSGLLVFTFIYDFTVGPVCYCLVAELSSTRLRAKTVVLSRALYNVGGIANNILTPRQLNESAWGWGAYSGLFWAGMNGLCLLWAFFRLPETKGFTYAELDQLFENKISARKFTKVDMNSLTKIERSEEEEREAAVLAGGGAVH